MRLRLAHLLFAVFLFSPLLSSLAVRVCVHLIGQNRIKKDCFSPTSTWEYVLGGGDILTVSYSCIQGHIQ